MDIAKTNNQASSSQCCQTPLSVAVALGWLSLGMIAAFPLLAIWKFNQHGVPGVAAVGVAFLLCFISAALALVVTGNSLSSTNAGPGLLLSILLRTGTPLLGGFLLASSVSPLASAGILGIVLLYYLVALVLETMISVLMIRRHHGIKA